jgi:very-short-patch-repair endonuclease
MPPRRCTPNGYERARSLRKNPTIAGRILWKSLRAHRLSGAGFRRQHAIGPYVVDFCAPRLKLIIEVDGSQHAEQTEYDYRRTEYLEQKGYSVLRFWNNEVHENLESVLLIISEKMLTPFTERGNSNPTLPSPNRRD